MRNQRHVALAGAAVVVAMMTSACGYGTSAEDNGGGKVQQAGNADDSGYGAGSGDGYGSGASGTGQTGAKKAPAKTLNVRQLPKLGDVVTDSKGWTLYRFDKDTAKPPKSNCNGDCESAWPPVPAKDATASAGIKASWLGKVKRADGTWQLTLGDWPVYRYAKDKVPGDMKGQGVGGTWSALAPNGMKAGEAEGGARAHELTAVDDPSLGKIVRDAKGRTLYRFDKDSAWPMKSNCTGACLEKWKPAKPVDANKLKGVAKKAISTYKRADGTKQLSIDCWPVYWFTGDKKVGDTKGHGAMDKWWAITPNGKKAAGGKKVSGAEAQSGSSSEQSQGDDGYGY